MMIHPIRLVARPRFLILHAAAESQAAGSWPPLASVVTIACVTHDGDDAMAVVAVAMASIQNMDQEPMVMPHDNY